MQTVELKTDIDNLLRKYEITLVPATETFSTEEMKLKKKEFKKWLKSNQTLFGDYEISLSKASETGFNVTFFSFARTQDAILKDKSVMRNGIDMGSVCDSCAQRLFCILVEDKDFIGKCSEDTDGAPAIREALHAEIPKKFDLNYPRQEVIDALVQEGFTPRVLGDVEIEGIYRKGGISVYI